MSSIGHIGHREKNKQTELQRYVQLVTLIPVSGNSLQNIRKQELHREERIYCISRIYALCEYFDKSDFLKENKLTSQS